MSQIESPTPPKPRGFAAMTPERRREIAAKGGRALKPEQRAYSRDRDLASAAGRLGGSMVPPEKRPFSVDREHAARCGRLGGQKAHADD
jgi:hypothetical protein